MVLGAINFLTHNFIRDRLILRILLRPTQQWTCNKVLVKDFTTRKSRCYTTMWRIVNHRTWLRLLQFSDINISQGNAATHLRCGAIDGIFIHLKTMLRANDGNTLRGVYAFDYNSVKSEPIWMQIKALYAHCWGLALSDFGRDQRSSDSLRASRNVFLVR